MLGIAQSAGRLTLDPFATRVALLNLLTDLVFFFLAVQLCANASRKEWRVFGLAVVIYASAISLFAIVQFFTMPRLNLLAGSLAWLRFRPLR